jgi:hypothetical protein
MVPRKAIPRRIALSIRLPGLYERIAIGFFFLTAASAVFYAGIQWGG